MFDVPSIVLDNFSQTEIRLGESNLMRTNSGWNKEFRLRQELSPGRVGYEPTVTFLSDGKLYNWFYPKWVRDKIINFKGDKCLNKKDRAISSGYIQQIEVSYIQYQSHYQLISGA